jgi:hypothetical protein
MWAASGVLPECYKDALCEQARIHPVVQRLNATLALHRFHRSRPPTKPITPRSLWQGFEVDASLLVRGVLGWMGGDQGPAAFPGASDGVGVGLGACELTDSPGPHLVQIVDDGDREVEQDVEHWAVFVGEFSPCCRDRG